MLEVRRSQERGHANHGWLDTNHTFSFGSYRDPEHMGFRVLRVINEDRVQPDNGFGTHPHENMEIISYVVSGELEHRDSMGNGSVITTGEFQVITAGTGITHSEFNPSKDDETHFYQIWIVPDTRGLDPAYGQKKLDSVGQSKSLELVATKAPGSETLKVNQDIKLYLGRLSSVESLKLPLSAERHGWLQIVKGNLRLGDTELYTGDGVALSEVNNPELVAETESEILFFDLP